MTMGSLLGRSRAVLPLGGGLPLDVFGNEFRLKLAGDESHGGLALIVATFAPGTGAPAHIHRDHDEAYYVIDGEFRFRSGDAQVEAGAGSICYAPRTEAHGFDNVGETDGHLLGILAPAGYEQHFVEMNAIPPGRDRRQWLAELYDKYDQEPVPPL